MTRPVWTRAECDSLTRAVPRSKRFGLVGLAGWCRAAIGPEEIKGRSRAGADYTRGAAGSLGYLQCQSHEVRLSSFILSRTRFEPLETKSTVTAVTDVEESCYSGGRSCEQRWTQTKRAT